MPAIARIRITNLVYENGAKRFLDDIFTFEGQNGILLLENGGGKTVLVQAILQAVIPNARLGERQARSTFALDNSPLHIGVEWVLNERPRRLGLTAVTLFAGKEGLESLKYVYEYQPGDPEALENLPFTRSGEDGRRRPAGREEMADYYQRRSREHMNAHYFQRLGEYHRHLEENLRIIPSEWMAIARINSLEGGVEEFFAQCKTTSQLVNNLLIPSIEEVTAGQGARDFALTFHQQRDHFQKYRLLQESIEENRLVESAIAVYTEVFRAFHQEEEAYQRQQSQAWALHRRACEDMLVADRLVEENRAALEEQERLEVEWQRKWGSWELAGRREELQQARQRLEKAEEDYQRAFQAWQENERRLQALELARRHQQIATAGQRIDRLEERLSRLGMEYPVQELEQSLAANGSALRFVYAAEEAVLRGREEQEKKRKQDLLREQQEWRAEKAGLLEDQSQARISLGRIQERSQAARDGMLALERKLLANPAREKVERERERWLERLRELAGEQADSLEKLRCHEEESRRVEAAIPASREALEESQALAGQLRHRLEGVNQAQNELLQRVRLGCQGFDYVESIYKKQPALQEALLYRSKEAEDRREDLMREERQLRGLDEMHSGSQYFAADPHLADRLQAWQTRFSYLQPGTRYVQEAAERLDKDIAAYYQAYSYWAISVVCQPADRERLMAMLEAERSRLSHPVLVLDLEAARGLLAGSLDPLFDGWRPAVHSVFPLSWERNLEAGCFADWQKEIQEASERATENRRMQEREWESRKQLLQAVEDFFRDYPLAHYRSLQDQEQEQSLKAAENRDLVLNLEASRQELARLILQDRDKGAELEREQHHLEQKVEQSGHYLELRRQEEQTVRQEILLREKAGKLAARLAELEQALERNELSLQECSAGIALWSQLAASLRKEALYVDTAGCEPIDGGESREILAEERRAIRSELEKRQQGRQELDESLSRVRTERQQYINELELFISRHRNEDIPEIKLPAGYEAEQERRSAEAPGLEVMREASQLKLREEEKQHATAEAFYNKVRADFHARFESEYRFEESLSVVKGELEKEKEVLGERARNLEQQRQGALEEQSDCRAAVAELDKKNERYEFLAEGVPEVALDADAARDFAYQRLAVAAAFAARLEAAREAEALGRSRLEEERRDFEHFANESIRDIKLKERTRSGIIAKKTFPEVLEWQANMKERIKQVIRVAEDDLQEHERELKQFVGRLHSYLAGLAHELRQIPRMTRVKAGDSWREIFQFDVPRWSEEEGKEALALHVDWMIEQLEDHRFRDQDGGENRAAILAELEKWLQSTSLLRNIMKGAVIKVKCRKVTADGRIGGSLMSWESSNQWSGGEKWSKNMALFLGLLNYMAEKRQPVSRSPGRQRTVLLDNPFGKASSEHVLAPVFFIAERLGFQIIALTALAEGQFVRDYFPVVYSCRLRQAAGRDQQVVTVAPEGRFQEMRHLQFQDLEPEALSIRLLE